MPTEQINSSNNSYTKHGQQSFHAHFCSPLLALFTHTILLFTLDSLLFVCSIINHCNGANIVPILGSLLQRVHAMTGQLYSCPHSPKCNTFKGMQRCSIVVKTKILEHDYIWVPFPDDNIGQGLDPTGCQSPPPSSQNSKTDKNDSTQRNFVICTFQEACINIKIISSLKLRRNWSQEINLLQITAMLPVKQVQQKARIPTRFNV